MAILFLPCSHHFLPTRQPYQHDQKPTHRPHSARQTRTMAWTEFSTAHTHPITARHRTTRHFARAVFIPESITLLTTWTTPWKSWLSAIINCAGYPLEYLSSSSYDDCTHLIINSVVFRPILPDWVRCTRWVCPITGSLAYRLTLLNSATYANCIWTTPSCTRYRLTSGN